ncbi:hypothetical protein Daus18300_012407 [Diaporthe australafricana]|uniref:Uncharacterized protein n=1 Tax=Diaporthe australafricana TaxID=127596 RepID=A0ABR3W2W2_9PEZI
MDFDEFANIASQVPALDAPERKAIAQLLPRVKRKFVKTIQTSTGKDVQYMEPAVMPYAIPDGGKNRSIVTRAAGWFAKSEKRQMDVASISRSYGVL